MRSRLIWAFLPAAALCALSSAAISQTQTSPQPPRDASDQIAMPTFLGVTQFPLSSKPRRLVQGDFNADGFGDLASIDWGARWNDPDTVSVLLHDRSKGFHPPLVTWAPTVPHDVATADFDADGTPDLVIGAEQGVWLMLSNRNGTFRAERVADDKEASVAVGDFNRDGRPDFATGWWQSFPPPSAARTMVYLNLGHAAFAPPETYLAARCCSVDQLDAVDLDADGDLDLVQNMYTPLAWLNRGDGTFGPFVETLGVGGVDYAFADFDGDGFADLAAVDASGGNVEISRGDGLGGFALLAEYPVIATQGRFVATGDFNGDGHADVAAGDDFDLVVLLLGRGDGSFELAQRLLCGGYHVTAGDVDRDGRTDLLGTSLGLRGELSVSYNTGDPLSPLTGAPAGLCTALHDRLEAGDVDGDGRLDLVAAGDSGARIDVLLNQGGGLFAAPVASSSGEGEALALGDVNGDGRLDAVLGIVPISATPNLEVLLGDGTGRFAVPTQLHNGSGAAIFGEALALADMDGDGALDIVSNTFTQISVLPGRGDGTFGAARVSGQGNGASSALLVRDFDGDGVRDVVTVADLFVLGQGTVVFLNLGRGDGTFDLVQTMSINARNPNADAGDVDGDGLPDLAIAGNGAGLYVARNAGGRFAPPLRYAASDDDVAVGDLNGDSRPEIITLEREGFFEIWINAGNGMFWPNPLVQSGTGRMEELELGEFVGSPLLDLVVLDSYINPSTALIYPNVTR